MGMEKNANEPSPEIATKDPLTGFAANPDGPETEDVGKVSEIDQRLVLTCANKA